MRKTAFYACFLAAEIMLAYAESFIPTFVAGVKPGLANSVSVLILYGFGPVPTLCVSLARVCICSILFGSPVSMLYGLSGAVFSVLGMFAVQKARLGTPAVSAVGAVMHGVGQCAAAYFTIGKAAFAYFPIVAVIGAVFGLITGILATALAKPLSRFFDTGKIKPFSAADIFAAAAFAVLAVLLLVPKGVSDTVKVSVNGELYGEYSLDTDRVVEIETEYGRNVLVIKDGTAYIEESDCFGGECKRMTADRDGGQIICLPHRLVISTKRSNMDAVSG